MPTTSTFTFDLLIPWFVFAAVLFALMLIQRWIHRHLFGVGYLISKEKHAATFFYYMLLMPGVFLHEFSHYMMAGVFGIKHKKFEPFPHAQEDGSLEMGFVELEEIKNPVHAAFVGIAPLLAGMGVVVLVSYSLLNLPLFFASFQSSDINVIGAAFQKLASKPDFLLWTYIVFAVSNAMMPSREDRRGWWIVGVGFAAIMLFLTVIGLQFIVINWLSGSLANVAYALTTVFGMVFALDCVAALIIWIIELLLERATGHKVEYSSALATAKQKAVEPSKLQSVYDLQLPMPPAPGKFTKSPRLPAEKPLERPAIESGQSGRTFGQPARPALPAQTNSTGVPSALTRPNPPQTLPTASPKPVSPTPARTFGTPAKPTPFGTRRNDDIIDADVVDDEEEAP